MTRAIMRDSRMFDRNSRPCAGCLRMCVYTSFFERFIIVASRLRLFYRGAACIYIRFIVRDCALHLSRLKGNYVGTRIFFFHKVRGFATNYKYTKRSVILFVCAFSKF